jgi:hypothetical protein
MATVSKKVKITFWVSTILVALMTVPSVFMMNDSQGIEIFKQLGITGDWFRYELNIGKTIGGLILLAPFINGRLKEWTYVALGLDFFSAGIALTTIMGVTGIIFPAVCLVILAVSYLSYHRIQGTKTPLY